MPSTSSSLSLVFLTCTILLLASATKISAVPLSPSAAVPPKPAVINDTWTLSHFYNDASSITTSGYTGVEKCMMTHSLEPYTIICSSNEKKWLKVTVSTSPDFVVTSTSSATGKCDHPFLHEDFGILGCFEGDRIYFYNLSTFEAISGTPSKLLTTVTSNSYYTVTGRYFVASDANRFIYKCDLMNLTSECVESDLVAALNVRPLDVVGSKDGTKLFVTTIEDSTNSQFLDYFNMSAEDASANLTNVDYEFVGADTTVFHELFMRYDDDTDTHFIYCFAKTFMVVTTQRGIPNSTHLSMTSSTARSSFFPTALGGFFFPSPAPSSSTKSTDYLIVVGQNKTKYGSPYDTNLVVSVVNLTSNTVTQAPPVGGCDPAGGEFKSVVMLGSNATDLFFQVFLGTGTDQCVFRMEAPSMTIAPPTTSSPSPSIPPPPPPTTTPTPDDGNNRNGNPSTEDDSSKKVAVIASTSVVGGLVVLGAIGGVIYYSVYYVKYRSVSVENNNNNTTNNNQQHQHDNNTEMQQHQQEPASSIAGNNINHNNNGFNNSTFSISNGTPSAV